MAALKAVGMRSSWDNSESSAFADVCHSFQASFSRASWACQNSKPSTSPDVVAVTFGGVNCRANSRADVDVLLSVLLMAGLAVAENVVVAISLRGEEAIHKAGSDAVMNLHIVESESRSSSIRVSDAMVTTRLCAQQAPRSGGDERHFSLRFSFWREVRV